MLKRYTVYFKLLFYSRNLVCSRDGSTQWRTTASNVISTSTNSREDAEQSAQRGRPTAKQRTRAPALPWQSVNWVKYCVFQDGLPVPTKATVACTAGQRKEKREGWRRNVMYSDDAWCSQTDVHQSVTDWHAAETDSHTRTHARYGDLKSIWHLCRFSSNINSLVLRVLVSHRFRLGRCEELRMLVWCLFMLSDFDYIISISFVFLYIYSNLHNEMSTYTLLGNSTTMCLKNVPS